MAIQTSIITFKGKLDNVVGMKGFGQYNLHKKVNPAEPNLAPILFHPPFRPT